MKYEHTTYALLKTLNKAFHPRKFEILPFTIDGHTAIGHNRLEITIEPMIAAKAVKYVAFEYDNLIIKCLIIDDLIDALAKHFDK